MCRRTTSLCAVGFTQVQAHLGSKRGPNNDTMILELTILPAGRFEGNSGHFSLGCSHDNSEMYDMKYQRN
jgi:hypothetical protein